MALPLPILDARNGPRLLSDTVLAMEQSRPDPTGQPPTLLIALPPAWANRYQVLLYSTAAEARYAVIGVQRPSDLAYVSWPGPVVLHAHWFASVFNGATSEAEAAHRFEACRAVIEEFRARSGAKLVWTAHNLVPHGNAFPETYLALRRWIFESFDAVHVMEAGHLQILEQEFGRKAPPHFVVPHMTYTGSMPDTVSRAEARLRYGIPETARVFACFGSIQRYKRLDDLFEATGRLAAETPGRPVIALVGGGPADRDAARELIARWDGAPHVRLMAQQVPDGEIQHLHRAADAMVLPYPDTLNSGAALMAASFGVPFLVPEGQLARDLGSVGAVLYAGEGPEALLEALRQWQPASGPRVAPGALETRHPRTVSTMFFRKIERIFTKS